MSARKRKYEESLKKRKLDAIVDKFNSISESLSDSQNEEYSVQETVQADSAPIIDFNLEIDKDCAKVHQDLYYQVVDPEIKEIQEWIVSTNTPHTHADRLLKILRKRLLPSLPKSTKTFLKCKVINSDIVPMAVCDNSVGAFTHFGIEQQLKVCVQENLHDSDTLELIVNIDGMSPFKSSQASMWPILCKIYTKQDIYEPFTAAVYSGSGKPKSSSEYLTTFVTEINKLLQHGVKVKNRMFKVKIKFFTCDCPARSFLKCVVGHTAFRGCERCYVLGKKVDGTTVFLQTDAPKKTNESFRKYEDPEYHTDASLLCAIEPPIDMVSQFVLDPMHLVYLGCTKRLLEYLLTASNNKVRLSATLKSELVRRSELVNQDIPEEFPRKMRPTDQFTKYKAVEFKFFVLYAAPVLLKNILSEDLYNHFMLLTVACRLLSGENKLNEVNQARSYLLQFVENASKLYGETFVTLNVHNLIHLSDDVEKFKCSLSELSAFNFESYLGGISTVLRSPTNLISQYCRRLSEKETFLNNEIKIPPVLTILVEKNGHILKLKYRGLILSIKHPNNTVLLFDDRVVEIIAFHKINNAVYMDVKKYQKLEPLFEYPCTSAKLHIWEAKRLSSTCFRISLEKVKQNYVKMNMNYSTTEEKNIFLVPLLH